MNRNSKKVRTNRKPAGHTGARRAVRRRRGVLPAAFILALCALALVLLSAKLFPKGEPARPAASEVQAKSDGGAALAVRPSEPVEPLITLAPQPTLEPTPEPTPRPTPEPTPFRYLPVVHRAKTEAKKIAVTVDDCYQLNNLQTIVDVAEANGAKLTLFPVGENLSISGMSDLMRRCAFDLGYEIENHTWSHERIFRLPDDEMAAEIWKQHAALNRALGVSYQQHFLRLMGGDGDTDPRIHSYLEKLGYLGIANWSVSGSDSDMAHIQSALAPGQIYLFHCTDGDTAKLEEFIPWAVSQGYRLVTLNGLFKLPDNETSALTDEAMPRPDPDVDDHHTLKEGEYTWTALRLQEKLRALGYLEIEGPSTGYYGPKTVEAVVAFQKASGLSPTGEADAETQRRILEG